MKLAKGSASLWVAERRGSVVYTRGGKAGAPGIPKSRAFPSDQLAERFLVAERDKRLAEGFVLIDAGATLDAPFTLDGRPRARTLSPRQERAAALVRLHVRAGFSDREAMERIIDDAVALGGGGNALRSQLEEAAEDERVAQRQASAPEPWVNEMLDAAFDAMNRAGIVAVQGDDVPPLPPRARGACFYDAQRLERAVEGHGLMLSFFTPTGDDEHARQLGDDIVATLKEKGLDPEWNRDPKRNISLRPFRWYRRPQG